jgi:hypothetical protein
MAHVTLQHGTEGPSHDPYAYEEWHIEKNGQKIVGHFGLAEWVEVDGKMVARNGDQPLTPAIVFQDLIGVSFKVLEKAYHRMRTTCKCGCRITQSMAGFPGESFNVCVKCGDIVSTDFHLSEII